MKRLLKSLLMVGYLAGGEDIRITSEDLEAVHILCTMAHCRKESLEELDNLSQVVLFASYMYKGEYPKWNIYESSDGTYMLGLILKDAYGFIFVNPRECTCIIDMFDYGSYGNYFQFKKIIEHYCQASESEDGAFKCVAYPQFGALRV